MNTNNLPVNGDAVVSALADQVRELSIALAMSRGTVAALVAELEAAKAASAQTDQE